MTSRKVFHDSVVELPQEMGLTAQGLMMQSLRPDQMREKMLLLFSLTIPPHRMAELEQQVARGETIPLDELQRHYTPNTTEVDLLVGWLKAAGFEITQVSADHTSVYARADISQIERALEIQMGRVTKNGFTYTAARSAPSLPTDIGTNVQAIIGLQPFRHVQKHSRRRSPRGGNRAWSDGGGGIAQMIGTSVANAPPYLVSEVLKAYNADDLHVTGRGQTIAILIDTFHTDSDLTAFWKYNGLPVNLDRIEKVNVKGGALPLPDGEESLDVEWASGVAPEATIRVYAMGSLSFVDLNMGLDRILADVPNEPGLRQLSISLGLGETFMRGPKGEVATQHQKFLRLAAAGVNVFVSSGDAGSNPDDSGQAASGPTQAEYSSSDPCVVGVGGTTLALVTNGEVAHETGWTSSGGGESIFFGRPVWQRGPGVPAGHARLVPDVSLTADPDEGAFVVLQGQVSQIGGTSWSAPIWAGFCALLNEARQKAKRPPLGFLNPAIYELIGTACFRDIKTGSNGAFRAGPGYDMVTGLGVPNVRELIRALTA